MASKKNTLAAVEKTCVEYESRAERPGGGNQQQ